MNSTDILKVMTPEIYQRFRKATETKKWPDGKHLTELQVETCLQAIIAYEHKYVVAEKRTGYIPPKKTPCEPTANNEQPSAENVEQALKWR